MANSNCRTQTAFKSLADASSSLIIECDATCMGRDLFRAMAAQIAVETITVTPDPTHSNPNGNARMAAAVVEPLARIATAGLHFWI